MQLIIRSMAVGENISRQIGHKCGQSILLDYTQTITHILQRSNIQEIIYVKHEGKIIRYMKVYRTLYLVVLL